MFGMVEGKIAREKFQTRNIGSCQPAEGVCESLDLDTGHYEVVQRHPGVPLVVLCQQVLKHHHHDCQEHGQEREREIARE